MIFSVFDYANKVFRYYEVKAETPPTAWFRRPIDEAKPDPNNVFSRTEVLAVRLPKNAVLTGTGPDARGVIATTQSGIGSTDPAGMQQYKTSPFIVAAAALFGWYIGRNTETGEE